MRHLRGKRHPASSGMTLIELLVVIGIVGLLLSLTAPALQGARERSRALKCSANLRQIGIAMHQYHETAGQLPMGRIRNGDPWDVLYPQFTASSGRSVHTAILPFLDAGECYGLFNFETPWFAATVNMTAELCRPSTFVCPTDSGSADRIGHPGSHVPFPDPPGGGWPVRLTQYGAMYGSIMWTIEFPSPKPWSDPHNYQNGCFTDQPRIRLSDIHDGLAATVFFTERAMSVLNPEGGATVWGRWTHTFGPETLLTGAIPPNYARSVPPESSRFTANIICGAYSDHPGGVHVLMADGSARFIGENIDSWALDDDGWEPCIANGLPCTTKPGVWQAMCTRANSD